MATSEETGILVFVGAACLLLILLIVACCHRYYKLKQMRATAAMLPDWDGRQQLNNAQPLGPTYMPAPANGNIQPLPNVLYTASPYQHPLPAHVQLFQQQHFSPTNRLPNAADRQDHPGTTPGAYQLNQQAAMATPNVVGCFYGAAYVPANPYGPTTYGLVVDQTDRQQQHLETAVVHQTGPSATTTNSHIDDITPPSYEQITREKNGMTAVSE